MFFFQDFNFYSEMPSPHCFLRTENRSICPAHFNASVNCAYWMYVLTSKSLIIQAKSDGEGTDISMMWHDGGGM